MRKNGSRLISLRQYRLTDLLIFAAILVGFDLLVWFAPKMFTEEAQYSFVFTLTVPVTLLIMMRWGWLSVFYAVLDGVLLSALYRTNIWQSYLSYAVGYAFLMLLLLVLKFAGKNRVSKKWYFSALLVISGWVLQNFGITVMNAICGENFVEALAINFGFGLTGLMSLAAAVVIILVMRRFDGMFEDQIQYLKRLDKEKKEKARRDTYGDEPIEIDEESLSILNKKDDSLY